MPAKTKEVKLPKAMGACADLLFTTNQTRKDLEKQVADLKKQETTIKEHIIQSLPKDEASGVTGKVGKVRVISKDVPQVEDWDKVYKYIVKNKAFELIQRRLSNPAVQERWDAKKKIPGIGTFKTITVSLSKA